ncbi:hypothetical protein MTP04_37130 [Lysinibacillus sp. PLM2]|nr:hypothetical protein MTP04_37130 [Lysinibacillus sp. PLM2]
MASIYFLCTGNSCRSQMAEGFAKKYLGSGYDVYSAGIEPRGLHPLAVEVMKEKGIDISNQTSDVVSAKLITQVDFVVTLCKDAKEGCPAILPRAGHYHWSFDDPAKARGTEEEVLDEFRRIRDEIEATIIKFIQGDTGVAFDANNTKLNYLKRKDDFGARIQKLREQKGLSIQDLEKKLNINDDYLSKTENNLTEPSKFFIHRLAWACGVEYEDLLDDLYYVEHSDILK